MSNSKAETPGRIASDARDRESIREKLTLCVIILKPADHPNKVLNIVTGEIAAPVKVNVDNANSIGQIKWCHVNLAG